MRRTSFLLAAGLVAAVAAGPVAAEVDDSAARAACIATCDAALASCQAAADAKAERCRADAFEPCKAWCPCTQFIGAAYFACLQECARCEAAADAIAAACPDASEARAECAAEHRRCTRACE
jgi:hypothetical protein